MSGSASLHFIGLVDFHDLKDIAKPIAAIGGGITGFAPVRQQLYCGHDWWSVNAAAWNRNDQIHITPCNCADPRSTTKAGLGFTNAKSELNTLSETTIHDDVCTRHPHAGR